MDIIIFNIINCKIKKLIIKDNNYINEFATQCTINNMDEIHQRHVEKYGLYKWIVT